ncbi:type II toxin-antitoxin system RelE/ParE family toxin [Streptomyces adustus]|uniref:type II toxin-antitoxin system RelE/ParE family toxin n=1 Tax=Streptomyces adustus TaxID=1609272 RepID=UPI003721A907
MVLYEVELEPEVRAWLAGLSDRDHAKVDFAVGMLLEAPLTLGEPWSRHLDGKTRELRFNLGSRQQRITYWIASGQRIVLLTQFRKTKQNESAEVTRALVKQEECETRHLADAAHVYSRTMKKGE